MMTKLLYKQIRLVSHPMTFVFTIFGVMLLIPNYPYTVSFFYVMLGLFFTFLNMREQKDIYYSALLPIRKRDTVKASCLFVVLIELLSVVIAVPFTIISPRMNPFGGNQVGVDANMTLLGFALLLYALFNIIFLPAFYQSAYKVGMAFLKAVIPVSLLMIAMEVSVHIPVLSWLDGYDTVRQLPVLIAGMVVYLGGTLLSFRLAAARYEKVDL
ncbi:MAG: ABC-2 transporter permease [Clostridiales bacterium]|nr:ABC-2 transporter permease [Clostridiales bacterium]